jgi:hypothetical protein
MLGKKDAKSHRRFSLTRVNSLPRSMTAPSPYSSGNLVSTPPSETVTASPVSTKAPPSSPPLGEPRLRVLHRTGLPLTFPASSVCRRTLGHRRLPPELLTTVELHRTDRFSPPPCRPIAPGHPCPHHLARPPCHTTPMLEVQTSSRRGRRRAPVVRATAGASGVVTAPWAHSRCAAGTGRLGRLYHWARPKRGPTLCTDYFIFYLLL